MLTVLKLYFLGAAGVLFFYALHRPQNAVRAFVLAMGTNVFPLFALPYMDMDIARLGGLPLVYLPGTAVGLALALRNGVRLPRRHLSLYVLMGIYLIYTLCNTVLMRGVSATNLMYWLAWPLNFVLLIAMAATVARFSETFMNRVLEACVMVLVAACGVGLLRYATGIGSDANFIPLMNRNGTVFLVALLFPLVFHVHAARGKSRLWLATCVSVIALCVVLTFSRSGLLGLMAGTILYYWRFSLMGLLKLSVAVVVIALFLQSGVAERSTERLLMAGQTLSAMMEGREVDNTVGDHNRVVLVNSALATAKEHFWFGTGLGMENYREGLRRAGLGTVTSKSHNFYLSYFTELGVCGFLLLLAVLQRIFASLPSLGSSQRAFRVSFLVTALMMTMNEYVLLPELWLLTGLMMGMAHQRTTATARQQAAWATLHGSSPVPGAGHTSRPALARRAAVSSFTPAGGTHG